MNDDPLGRHGGKTSSPRTRLWYLLPIFFGILVVIAIAIISESTNSSDNSVISEAIFKNPLQVYEINTVCELADLLLENNFSFQSYHADFEKQFPTEWNDWQSYYKESEENILKNYESKTLEQVIEQETEQKIKLKQLYHKMPMKYFSINPELEDEYIALYEFVPLSLLWLKDEHPKCYSILNEKYGY